MLILHDLRPGDVLDLSWSLVGPLPQLDGHVAEWVDLGRAEPVRRLRARVVVPAEVGLRVSLRNGALPPAVREIDAGREYSWDLSDVAPTRFEADTPDWFSPVPSAELSDFTGWAEVARWATTLVRPELPLRASVEAVVAPWRALQEEQRADAAVRFVREEVRYFGMENGIHAHRAHAPSLVLSRRFGDCKDKALLLATLLRALGLEADVALVNPSSGAKIEERLPGPLPFSHAIVRAAIAGARDGSIPPCPASAGACPFCPLSRMAAR